MPITIRFDDSRRGSVTACLLLAAGVGVVAATATTTRVAPLRYKLVVEPLRPSAGGVDVPLPPLAAVGDAAVAVIARVRNDSAAVQPLEISVAGRPLARLRVPPGAVRRVDASLPPGSARAGVALHLQGADDAWTLTYLEIGDVHGHSTGVFGFLLEPASGPGRGIVPAAAALLLTPLLGWLLVRRPRVREPRALQLVGRAAGGLAVAVLAIALASPFLTPYRIRLSQSLLLVCVGLLLQGWLIALPARALARIARGEDRTEPAPLGEGLVRTVVVPLPAASSVTRALLVALFVAYVGSFYDARTGFTSLIEIGSRFYRRAVAPLRSAQVAVVPGVGYDGQFYAQLALDPLLREPETTRGIDRPGYRARRVLLPWVAYIAGGGRPGRILQAYALANVVCWLLLAVLLARRLGGSAIGLACWAGCLFSYGMIASVRLSLTEGPAALLLVLALRAVETGRHRLAYALTAIAGLGRETNLLWAGALAAKKMRGRRLLLGAAGLALPLAAWTAYLASRGLTVGMGAGRNLDLPLRGYVGKTAATLAAVVGSGGLDLPAAVSMACLVGLTVQVGALAALRRPGSPWWRAGAVFAAFALLLGEPVWRGDPGAAVRLLLPLTIAFNVLLYDEASPVTARRLLLLAAGNLTAVAGLGWLLARLVSAWGRAL